MMRAALKYAAAGLLVIPLRGKRPVFDDWGSLATRDQAVIRDWWSGRWKQANVGIVTGAASGVFVLDVDIKEGKDGDVSLAELESKFGKLPETKQGLTGSGGGHFWFRFPRGVEIRNRTNFRPGLDIRGEGGYVVAPPSVHPETRRAYEWEVTASDADIPAAPAWLIDIIRPAEPVSNSVRAGAGPVVTTPYGRRILERVCGEMAATESGRNEALNKAAFELGQYVGGREIAYDDARSAIDDAAMQAAMFGVDSDSWLARGGRREIMSNIEGGLADGQKHPRAAPPRPDRRQRRPEPPPMGSADAPVGDGPRGPEPPPVEEPWDDEVPEFDDDLPVICRRPNELGRLVDRMESAVVEHAREWLFARDGNMVRVWRDETQTLRLHELDHQYLQYIADQAAHWMKPGSGKKRWVPENAPMDVAGILIRKHEWQGLRGLSGVTDTPIVRLDGTVHDQAGYDDATMLYFDPGRLCFPEIELHPDPRAAGEAALASLSRLLMGYNFDSDVDRSVAFAAFLTAVVRPSIPTAPMFLFDALNKESGKSNLAATVMMVGAGEEFSPMAQLNPEETEKRITAALLGGSRFFVIDNVDRPVGNAPLDLALTGPMWTGRELSASRQRRLQQRMMFITTGNRLRLRGDLSRRVMGCRLRDAHPDRDVDKNPLNDARDNRAEYVADVLTIIRAYHASGGRPPDGTKAYPSYAAWDKLVRHPLMWLGLPDPLLSRRHFDTRDSVAELCAELVALWFKVFNDTGRTAPDVCEEITSEHAGASEHQLLEVIETIREVTHRKKGKLTGMRLGRLLADIVSERPSDSMKIVRSAKRSAGGWTWSIAHLTTSPAPPPV